MVRFLNGHSKTGQFRPFYSFKTDHLKTKPFEFQDPKVPGSLNGLGSGIKVKKKSR
jgi:hypothetical protein